MVMPTDRCLYIETNRPGTLALRVGESEKIWVVVVVSKALAGWCRTAETNSAGYNFRFFYTAI